MNIVWHNHIIYLLSVLFSFCDIYLLFDRIRKCLFRWRYPFTPEEKKPLLSFLQYLTIYPNWLQKIRKIKFVKRTVLNSSKTFGTKRHQCVNGWDGRNYGREKSEEREKSKETNQLRHFVQYIRKYICANKHFACKNYFDQMTLSKK